ncbi:MAG TPA: hypothetical protein VK009_18875 [Chloroflexota bacterium]|nr:hypothetical protein [Chloroflexota bacterium]
MAVHSGVHQIGISAPGFLSESLRAEVLAGGSISLQASLWRAQPATSQLLPPLPGAGLAGADFLRDGRVALLLTIPPGDERQLWIEGPGSEQRRVGPALARGSAAVSADGARVAYLAGPDTSLGSGQPPTELWLSAVDGQGASRRYALPQQNGTTGQLLDVAWSPDGGHLLLVARQAAPAGGQRTVLSWLAADQGDPQPLVSLPDDVVAGSYSWSPDGAWVTFLATGSGHTSLCLLGVPNGDFRYLGDVNSGGLSHPLPVSPVSWAADGSELLYSASASRQADVGGWLFAAGSATALYTVRPATPAPQLVPDGQGQSPTWLPDGSLLTLARGKAGGPLLLRHLIAGSPPVDGPPLPLTAGPAFAARWDPSHAQALIVVHGDGLDLASSNDQYWLARFRPEAGS